MVSRLLIFSLFFFCDQNSDACERLFTSRIADLHDEYIPGSKGTSLYIRAVCRLIDPFRKIDFGSQAEIQVSVSSAIIIIRLWRRDLELQKLLLHSKPGAKNYPSKRGKFVTNGCYISAEILFAAATLYQLAMFLHFRDVGLFGSSLSSILAPGPQSVLSANCRGRRMKFNLLIPSQCLQICLIKFPRCSST